MGSSSFTFVDKRPSTVNPLPRNIDQTCPACNHSWNDSVFGMGCVNGWKFRNRAVLEEGCKCPLTHCTETVLEKWWT